jgi:hypothetical protein
MIGGQVYDTIAGIIELLGRAFRKKKPREWYDGGR